MDEDEDGVADMEASLLHDCCVPPKANCRNSLSCMLLREGPSTDCQIAEHFWWEERVIRQESLLRRTSRRIKMPRGKEDQAASVQKTFHILCNRFEGRPLEFNFKQLMLTMAAEGYRNHKAQRIHSYPARMFPYIPAFFLSIDCLYQRDGTVLDPFCGSGTVLLESISNPIRKRNSLGVEINPLGRLIAKVKTTPLDLEELTRRKNDLLKSIKSSGSDARRVVPEFKALDFWFSRKAVAGLGKVRYCMEREPDDDYKDFFQVCFSSIIRKVARADPFIPPPVRLRVSKYKGSPEKLRYLRRFLEQTEKPNVLSLFERKVEDNMRAIASLSEEPEIAEGTVKARVIWDDARHIRVGRMVEKARIVKDRSQVLPARSVNLVMTSPPYLTAQKYIRTHRLEIMWLGLVSEEEVSMLDKDIIGSERVSAKDVDLAKRTGVTSVDALIRQARSTSPGRAATILKYFLDMEQALSEIHRVLSDDSFAVVVVGDNKVNGRPVRTHALLTDLACSLGFKVELTLADKIRGRGMISKRHNSGGLIEREFAICLKKGG